MSAPDCGLMVERADRVGQTPLDVACRSGSYDAALALLVAGARAEPLRQIRFNSDGTIETGFFPFCLLILFFLPIHTICSSRRPVDSKCQHAKVWLFAALRRASVRRAHSVGAFERQQLDAALLEQCARRKFVAQECVGFAARLHKHCEHSERQHNQFVGKRRRQSPPGRSNEAARAAAAKRHRTAAIFLVNVYLISSHFLLQFFSFWINNSTCYRNIRGYMTANETESILRDDGSFLVRNGPLHRFVVSFRMSGRIFHTFIGVHPKRGLCIGPPLKDAAYVATLPQLLENRGVVRWFDFWFF